jgi:hypothetical protein
MDKPFCPTPGRGAFEQLLCPHAPSPGVSANNRVLIPLALRTNARTGTQRQCPARRLTPTILATQRESSEDHDLKPARANSSRDPIQTNPSQKRSGRVAQGAGPEFKPQ